MAKCNSTNSKDQPCGAPAVDGTHYCYMHAPHNKETAAEARRQGGRNRKKPQSVIACPDGIENGLCVLAWLNWNLHNVSVHENSIQRARTINSILRVALEALEQINFQVELDELKKEVERLNNAEKISLGV